MDGRWIAQWRLAMGVDDSTFTLTIRKADPVRPDGCVVIEASEG